MALVGSACTNKELGGETAGKNVGAAEGYRVKVLPVGERDRKPVFAGQTLDGANLRSSELSGSVAVVNFWSTFCGPCRKEQPILERVWRAYKDKGVRFVGIDIRDNKAAANAFIDEFDVTYPSVFNPDSSIAAEFGVTAPPSTFVLDREGRIAARLVGAAETDEELTRAIDEVLAT